MDIEEIIEKIGGGVVRTAAEKLGIPLMTVRNWRARNSIPPWRHDHIRNVAAQMGIVLSEKEASRKAA